MSNMSLAKEEFSCRTFATACHHNQFVHLCVWEVGVGWGWSKIKISWLSLLLQKLRVMKKLLTRVGMPFSIFGLLSDTLFILPCSHRPIVSLQSCGRFYSSTVLKTYFHGILT